VSRQRESKMKKATYEQLVAVAAEFAKNNNCSYAIAAKLYKVTKVDLIAWLSLGTQALPSLKKNQLSQWQRGIKKNEQPAIQNNHN
jgi:hypothetical protein